MIASAALVEQLRAFGYTIESDEDVVRATADQVGADEATVRMVFQGGDDVVTVDQVTARSSHR